MKHDQNLFYLFGAWFLGWMEIRARRFALLAAVLLLMPSAGSAAQFVLFDVIFTFTKQDADNSKPSKSHFYVKGPLINPERPRDWTAPVDYRNGTAHIRLEVLDKPPGIEPTTWSICYIPNKGQGNGYGCMGSDVYREKGVYEKDVSMKSFWQNDAIVWAQGIKQMDLVMKDNSGGSGHAHKRPDHEKFFPTKIRMTVIQVSAGAKYDPSLVPGLPPKASSDKKTKDGVKKSSLVSEEVLETRCCGDGPNAVISASDRTGGS
ncbi:MAG: hypothetical protein AB1705_02600 [Verrucomicrobiota bacterium]